jgi:hypothetical protein
VYAEFSKNRSWAYFEKQNAAALLLFKPSGTKTGHRPHYLSKPSDGFAQIIYVQLQFFDHLAHNFIAKGLNNFKSLHSNVQNNPFRVLNLGHLDLFYVSDLDIRNS